MSPGAARHIACSTGGMHRLSIALLLVACESAPALDASVADAPSELPDVAASLDAPSPDDAPDVEGACTDAELAALEAEMSATLGAAVADTTITSNPVFTVLLEASDGRRYAHSHGASTGATEYESASTSKWVSAVVILELVDRGVLSLDTRAHDLLPFWAETEVDLRDLLSFTSGFADENRCINQASADFAACVEAMYDDNVATAPPPGAEYQYSGSHLQIAGLMAIRAAGAADWTELFQAFQSRTGLFPTGRYDLPSLDNPRLAGGMTWTGEEYLGFLSALYHGEILSEAMRAELLRNQRGSAVVTASPAFQGLHEDWSYGLGNWLECRTATELGTYDCGEGHRNSSAGAYGAYPFMDRDEDYVGIVARQGRLGSGDEGALLFRTIEVAAARWANRRCP